MDNSNNLDGQRFHHSLHLLMELEMQMEIDRMKRSGEIQRIAMPVMKDGKRVGRAFLASTVGDMEADHDSIKKLWNEDKYLK